MDSTGVKKVILLDNDSTSSLVLNRNFGELPSRQRKFVNEMIDLMEELLKGKWPRKKRSTKSDKDIDFSSKD